MITSPQAATSSKKKKKKKKKNQSTSAAQNISAFIQEASNIASTLDPRAYEALKAKYPIDAWVLENKLSIEKIEEVVKQNTAASAQVGPAFTVYNQEIETINVLHAILMSLSAANNLSSNAQSLRFVLWHLLMEIYCQHTEALAMVGLLSHELGYLKDTLIHYYALIEHYDPQLQTLIEELVKKEDKVTGAQYAQRSVVGIWGTYLSSLNIEHYHATFFLKIGSIDKVPAVLARLKQKIKATDENKISRLLSVDDKASNWAQELQQVTDCLNKVEDEFNRVTGNARSNDPHRLLTIDEFLIEVSKCRTSAQLQEKDFFKKYAHLFNENIKVASLDYIVQKALEAIEEPDATDVFSLKKLQKAIYLMHFALTHLVSGESEDEYNQQYLSYFIVTLLARALSNTQVVLMQAKPATLAGKYITLSELMEDNFSLLCHYNIHVFQLFESLLQNRQAGEKQKRYADIKLGMLNCYFNQLAALSKYCQFNFTLCKVEHLQKAIHLGDEIIAYLQQNTKKLVQTCQAAVKKTKRQIEQHKENQKTYRNTVSYIQKQPADALKIFDEAIVKLLTTQVVFAQRAKVDPNALRESIKSKYKTAAFDESLSSLVASTIHCLNVMNGTFDNLGDAQLSYDSAVKLCEVWVEALKYHVANMKSDYIKLRKVHFHILIERLGKLAQYFTNKKSLLEAHRKDYPAREMVEPFQLICLGPGDAQYKKLYQKYQAKYFADEKTATSAITNIHDYVKTSPFLSKRAKFNVLHAVLQALPREHFDQNHHLLCTLWEWIGDIVKEHFDNLSNRPSEIGNYLEYHRLMIFYLALATHYKACYQMLLNDVLQNKEENPQVLASLKGNFFKHQFIFFELDLVELLILEVGGVERVKQQLPKALERYDSVVDIIPKIENLDGKLSDAQQESLRAHGNKLRQLQDKMAGHQDSPLAALYCAQIRLTEKVLFFVAQLKEKKLASIHNVGDDSPLVTVERMREEVTHPDAQTVDALTLAFEKLLEERFLFEASFFIQGFVELCNNWSVTLKESTNTHLGKMVAEKFQEISSLCVNALPEITIHVHDTLDDKDVADFIEEVGAKDALICDKEYPEMLARFKDKLFRSRPHTFLAMGRIIYELKQRQDLEVTVNVSHFLNSCALIRLQEEQGPLKGLSQQMMLFLWENLLYCYSTLSANVITKKIPPGTYIEHVLKLERLNLLKNIYLTSICGLQLQWYRVQNCDNTPQVIWSRWMLSEVIYSFEIEYVYSLIAQGDLNAAKAHYEQAKQLLENMKAGKFAKVYFKQLNDLEVHIVELAPYFTGKLPEEAKMVQIMGLVVKKSEQFEEEFTKILQSLTQAPQQITVQGQILDLERNTKEKQTHTAFGLFLNNLLQLREPCYRHQAHAIVAKAVSLFKKFKAEFEAIEHQRLDDSIIKELLSEKIAGFISACENALPNIVVPLVAEVVKERKPQEASSQAVVLLTKQFKNQSLTSKTPKQKQPQAQEPIVTVKKDPTVDEQTAQQIKALLLEAQSTRASCDNDIHGQLVEKYGLLFNEDKTIWVVIKSALSELEGMSNKKDKITQQRVVNLAHFVLHHCAIKVANNEIIKRNLMKQVWESLKSQIEPLMAACKENKISLGKCIETFEELKGLYTLYDFYAVKSIVRKDPQHFALLPKSVCEQWQAYQEGMYEILSLCHREIAPPVEGVLPLGNFTACRTFNSANVKVACELFYKTKESAESIQNFSNVLAGWIIVLQKGKQPFADKLIIEKLQRMVDDCKEVLRKKPVSVKRQMQKVSLQNPAEDRVVDELTEVTDQLKELIVSQEQQATACLALPEETQVVEVEQAEPIQRVPSPTKQKMVSLVGEIASFKPREPKEIILENAQRQLRELFTLAAFSPIQSIFNILRENKIKVTLTGGFIRDFLLSNGHFHDYDIRIACSLERLQTLYPGAYQPISFKRPELVRLHELDDLGIRHDIICSENEPVPDFCINGLQYDGVNLEDPYDGISDIFSSTLRMIGDSEKRFECDPTLILRSVRLINSTKKYLEEKDAKALIKHAPRVTSLEMGLYITNLAGLFLRSYDQAMLNLDTLINSELLSCLLPVPLCDDPSFREFVKGGHLHQELTKLYAAHTYQGCVNLHAGTPYYKQLSYRLISLCLLPFVKNDSIENVVEHYCDNYAGFRKRVASQNEAELKVDKAHTARRLIADLKQLCAKQELVQHHAGFTPMYERGQQEVVGVVQVKSAKSIARFSNGL